VTTGDFSEDEWAAEQERSRSDTLELLDRDLDTLSVCKRVLERI
jgi:hypothetical protein